MHDSPTIREPEPRLIIAAPPIADEALKRDRLVRMKRFALLLLLASGVVFVIALIMERRYGWIWLGYVRAAAEASVVGGVADWFAVTALFRHPLGIPIPHTAIVPARKDRIGRALGNFVQQNFLDKDVVARKLAALRLGDRTAQWLSEPANARTVTRATAHALTSAANVLRDEDVQSFLERTAGDRLRSVQVAPLLGRALRLLTADGRHQELLDEALRLAARATEANDALIREKVQEQTPWWIPNIVDRRISDRVVSGIGRTLAEVSADPDHPLRLKFDHAVRNFIERLQSSPETIARAEALKEELLADAATREFIGTVWSDVKRKLRDYALLTEDAEFAGGKLEGAIASLAHNALEDPVLSEKLNNWIDQAVLAAVDVSRTEIAQLISGTVSAWDPQETSRRIELQIGRDLQFVRINGTIVGGMVGLLLYALTRAL
ncbi:MAG TPA: DUF445 domain-containing protein [Gemmatimonadaceae bacterium]|nr:DUF445 domain-containing protein [Gemmatimonadaceae bacterium]